MAREEKLKKGEEALSSSMKDLASRRTTQQSPLPSLPSAATTSSLMDHYNVNSENISPSVNLNRNSPSLESLRLINFREKDKLLSNYTPSSYISSRRLSLQ